MYSTVLEAQYDKPLYNKILGITNNFLYPSNSKIYGKEPCLQQNLITENRNFTSPLALGYIKVPLYAAVISRYTVWYIRGSC